MEAAAESLSILGTQGEASAQAREICTGMPRVGHAANHLLLTSALLGLLRFVPLAVWRLLGAPLDVQATNTI